MTNNNIVSDYVTELVLLLFIKMVHENTEAGLLAKHPLPEGCRWTDLNDKDGLVLLDEYKKILFILSTGKDTTGKTIHEDPLIQAIYTDASTRLREPNKVLVAQIVKVKDERNLAVINPGLASEWHPEKNVDIRPEDVRPKTNRKIWWQCSKGHEWQAVVASRAAGSGCPYCYGRFATKTNNLASKYPELLEEWD